MQQSPTLTVEATVSSIAHGGSGVVHVEHRGERRAVFVGGVVPGDRVVIEANLASRPARGRLVTLVAPGPDRVAAPCAWSTECGACDWMHVSIGSQAQMHADQLRSCLPAAWRDVPVDVHAAPASLGYRVRSRVHVRCGRGGRVTVGMHAPGSRDPVEVPACIVLHPALDRARTALASLFEGCSGRGEVQLGLGVGGIPVAHVRWAGPLSAAFFGQAERRVAERSFAGIRVLVEASRRPADVGDPTPWMEGPDGRPLRLGIGAFGQANEAMNGVLGRYVARRVEATNARKAVELHAGSGNLSVILAPAVGDLVCVEASREGCDAARANLAARGLAARVTEADAETYVWRPATDLVVLDPPRAGARAIAERLAGSRVAGVVYVSCDAPTLGRDLALLERCYALRSIATFEMFPQTSHVEIVTYLERRERARPRRSAGAGPAS
jgi:23S rRNA (uracil1939-C5)-methyltransferase